MQLLEHWDPLSLPRGSVRALITLALLGVLWALILLGREVPLPLAYIALMVVAYYFGARAGKVPQEGGSHPLYLPRGSIRTIIILGFAAVTYILWSDGRLVMRLEDRPFTVLLLAAGLLAGFLVGWIADLLTGGRMPAPRRWFENLKAVVALAATLLFAVLCITGFQETGHENLALLSTPLVVFYFGSRK